MLPTNTWIAECEPHKKSALIYALGGGNGHFQRAVILSKYFANTTIMHQVKPSFSCLETVVYPKSENLISWSSSFIQENPSSFDCVVVDTFPQGIGHELHQRILAEYSQSFLVARYLRAEQYSGYQESCSWYTKVLLPYSPNDSEWDVSPKGIYIGTLTRPISISIEKSVELCIIGNPNKIPIRWHSLFPSSTCIVQHRFHTLPKAHRYLCVGAGYNLFWELHSIGVSAGHIALEKRYDDQFLRAGRLGRLISTYQQLQRFFATTGT